MSDPVRLLMRALTRSAAAAGCAAELTHAGEMPWVSLTFSGARHAVAASGEPEALGRWLAMLPEAELPLNGHFVASCAAEIAGGEATIELLVLED